MIPTKRTVRLRQPEPVDFKSLRVEVTAENDRVSVDKQGLNRVLIELVNWRKFGAVTRAINGGSNEAKESDSE